MTCQDFDKLLHPYVDGEFDAAERLLVEEHLAGCNACAKRVHAEKAFRDAFRMKVREGSSTTRAPDSLRRNVLASIQREHRATMFRKLTPMASAAAVLLV